ncbi:glutamine synthetase [Nocardioides mangrovicus]|uniref:Glutamine synthetase n=1 Tax=Nocardioides mangrovicus TaxID=2478913 RepID=A0A3L8NXJ9_9ACTN|nr:glutamine synthetase family protein [Nocardioides mangrovicus]RLV47561.1 glutamine synthetase [Nocardioides mangrovicus]
MDAAEREHRRQRAENLLAGLEEQGVVAVATSFVDNAGVSRVKSVPLDRLPSLAAWGVGFSTAFDFFRFDDWVAAPPSGVGPVGDQRIVPDLDRLVVRSALDGWAWAPGERFAQDGSAYALDSRLLLRRLVADAAAGGLTYRAAYEIEWVVSLDDTEFVPAASGPAYGLARLGDASDYSHDVLAALAAEGVTVEQYHPEYAPGQFELSVAPEDPVGAADTSVLVRDTVRAVGRHHGFVTSFSPKVDVAGVGNGGHVHLSLWRDGQNLMAGGQERFGLTAEGVAFAGGVLAHLPGLLAIGAPGVASYLRLVPQHWAGAYACWGLENREAALRMVTGSTGSESAAANLEVKSFDLQANPYLLLAGLLAAGTAGADLPEPVDVDPASLGEDELARRGIGRLPTSLRESLDAFAADEVLTTAFGPQLVEAIVAVRESELELFADASPEEVAAAVRWVH